MGRLFVDVSTLESLLVKAGFVDVELRIFKWPMNGWPKDEKYEQLNDTFLRLSLKPPFHWVTKHVSSFPRSEDIFGLTLHVPLDRYKKLGLWCHENFSGALEAVCMALLTRVHGWTRDEVDIFLIDVRRDLKNRSYHAYFPMLVSSPLFPSLVRVFPSLCCADGLMPATRSLVVSPRRERPQPLIRSRLWFSPNRWPL